MPKTPAILQRSYGKFATPGACPYAAAVSEEHPAPESEKSAVVSTQPRTFVLSETGIARLDDGTEAVNVGPILSALGYLTEQRGDDRGTGENGEPLPDLLSLAFEVVKSIILGGRHADFFRQVKRDFDQQAANEGTSLTLAKRATSARRSGPYATLAKASLELRGRLQKLDEAATTLIQDLEAHAAGKKLRVTKRKARRAKTPDVTPARAGKPKRAVKPEAKPTRASKAKRGSNHDAPARRAAKPKRAPTKPTTPTRGARPKPRKRK